MRQRGSKGNCSPFPLHSIYDCWLVFRLSGEGYNPAPGRGVGCCWRCHWMGVKWGVICCFIAFGVLFLTPDREALVGRVSSLPWPFEEFLTGCRPKSGGLLKKSCHRSKDTLLLFTIPYTFSSPPFASEVSIHTILSSGSTHSPWGDDRHIRTSGSYSRRAMDSFRWGFFSQRGCQPSAHWHNRNAFRNCSDEVRYIVGWMLQHVEVCRNLWCHKRVNGVITLTAK